MMIPILRYPDFTGNRYSRSSSDVTVDNAIRLPGFLSLSIHRALTPGKSNASRAKPQTRTRGTAKFDGAKGKLFVEDYNLLVDTYLRRKAAAQGMGLFEVSFQLTCTVFEPQLGTTRWDLLGCRIVDETTEPVSDTDDKEIPVDLDLDVMDALKDGFSIVNEVSAFGQIGQNV